MKKISLFRNADKKTIIWIAALALVCAVCLLAWLLTGAFGSGTTAVVRVDGEEMYRINLSAVREEYDIEITTEYGSNTVHVSPGSIAVTESNCPDKVCVRQGAISQSGVPIVCMPHKLSVRIEGSGIDG